MKKIDTQYRSDAKRYALAVQKWEREREDVKKENERLIKYWNSIPWYRFWERPSFEEKRSIIVGNWQVIHAPRMEQYFNFPYLSGGSK